MAVNMQCLHYRLLPQFSCIRFYMEKAGFTWCSSKTMDILWKEVLVNLLERRSVFSTNISIFDTIFRNPSMKTQGTQQNRGTSGTTKRTFNTLKRTHFPVHIRNVHKWVFLGCVVHHLAFTAQPRGQTGMGKWLRVHVWGGGISCK